jgi:hypothetical protein
LSTIVGARDVTDNDIASAVSRGRAGHVRAAIQAQSPQCEKDRSAPFRREIFNLGHTTDTPHHAPIIENSLLFGQIQLDRIAPRSFVMQRRREEKRENWLHLPQF